MSILLCYRKDSPVLPEGQSTNLSSDLNGATEVANLGDGYLPTAYLAVSLTYHRLSSALGRGLTGYRLTSFLDDYYDRIHVTPATVDLGTIGGTISRPLSIWNAYRSSSATLNGIVPTNAEGVTVTGVELPFTLYPQQEIKPTLVVTTEGPPDIAASILFDFTDVTDPLPIIVKGNRAVLLPQIPDEGVTEAYEWLTDISVSIDGTEQRVGLRSAPRRKQNVQITGTTAKDVREQLRSLQNAKGRLFLPFFQWAAVAKQRSAPGSNVIFTDPARLDVRAGDYVVVVQASGTLLTQIDTVGTTSITTRNPLSASVEQGAIIAPTFACMIENNAMVRRFAVDEAGSVSLQGTVLTHRPDFVRPGSTATLTMLAGMVVLSRQQMTDGDESYAFDTGQEVMDAATGLQSVENSWDFTKVVRPLQFIVHRATAQGPVDMDYWRAFFEYAHGSLRPFLVPTFRTDQLLASTVASQTDNLILAGGTYFDDFYPVPAYRYLAISTDAGVHYCSVTSATKNADGDTAINFSPPLPSGASWTTIQKISYLVKSRISNDRVQLRHDAIDTTITFAVRSIK
jgi:hypothetical protein